jgi:4-hydroxy-2-oxoheptanedioate aldolase
VEAILAACLRRGVVPGIHCGSAATARRWLEAGFRMVNVASDAVFLRQGAAAALKAVSGEPSAEVRGSSSYA